MYPAKGIVLSGVFFNLNNKCKRREKNNENVKKTKKEIMEKQKHREMKNKISPIPIPWLISFCFKISFE